MPIYTFKCSVCGDLHDEVRTIAQRDLPSPCPRHNCDGAMERDVIASMEEIHSTDQGYQKPILSEALGIHPSQIAEAKQRFPHHEFTPDGRMILTSHNQRKRILKELGFRDHNSYY